MKRWIALAVFVVVLSTAATVAVQYMPASTGDAFPVFPVGSYGSKTAGALPKAVLEGGRVYEFGTMPQQATGKHSFVVKNTGRADLILTMISSTCSCTLAKFKDGEKAVVKPGESTDIVLEFETRVNNGDYDKGAEIGTNDPDLERFSLRVHGKVYPAVMTIPASEVVNFSNIANDVEDHQAYFALYSKDRPGLKIVKTTSSDPKQVVVTHEPASAADCKELKIEKGWKVGVNVKAGLPLGAFRHEVVVTTDHPKQPEVRMTVVGTMSGPVNIQPGRLIMHGVNGQSGDAGGVIVTVRNNRETRFEVVEAPPGLKVEIKPVEGSTRKGRYRLSVMVPPGTTARDIESEVVLKTDHPKAGKVIVPVSIWVQGAP